jgi:hypothetical protein
MNYPLRLPYGDLQRCYDVIRQETPLLWQRFQEDLYILANDTAPIENRIAKIAIQSDTIWHAFIDQHNVPASSTNYLHFWHCCIEDMIGAVIAQELGIIEADSAPTSVKKARIESLIATCGKYISSFPKWTMLKFQLMTTAQRYSVG